MDAQSETCHGAARAHAAPLDYATPPRERTAGARYRLAEAAVALGVVAVIVALLLPSLEPRGYRQPLRLKCQSNMRQILLACHMYASEHGGRFPDRLDSLITYLGSTKVFICPASNDPPAAGATLQAQAASFAQGGHSSYVYVGVGLTNRAAANTVILYEARPQHPDSARFTSFGFADGTIKSLTAAEGQQLLALLAASKRPVAWPAATTRPTTTPSSIP